MSRDVRSCTRPSINRNHSGRRCHIVDRTYRCILRTSNIVDMIYRCLLPSRASTKLDRPSANRAVPLVDGTHQQDVLQNWPYSLITNIRCNPASASGCAPSHKRNQVAGVDRCRIWRIHARIINAGPVRQLAVDVDWNVCRCTPRGRRRRGGPCPSAHKEKDMSHNNVCWANAPAGGRC